MLNPYKYVNWKTVKKIPSTTHMHIMNQEALDNGYKYGIRHFPISNYYPSAPYNKNPRPSDFKLNQTWPCRRGDETVSPPINWNDIITWADEFDEPYKSNFPFAEDSKSVYTNIPDDVILSANAEHHGFNNLGAHICCPGSSFVSGNFNTFAF